MEYTTRFTLVCKNDTDADALHAVFSTTPDGAPLEAALTAFFAARKIAIHPTDQLGFDHYERAGRVIDAVFTSGSTDVGDFIAPLAKVCQALHAELVDDEVARKLEYGFIDGKKKPPADVVALMNTLAPTAQLGRVGRIIEAAEREQNDPTYAFIRAIGLSKNVAAVQALLEKGADPNSKLSSGYSCLSKAISNKSVKIVQLMLEHGANPNLAHKGALHLYEACRYSSPKIVDLLLKHGADPNASRNDYYHHAIEMAVSNHLPQAVKSLMAHGAKTSGMRNMRNLLDLNAENFDNKSGQLLAKIEIFKLLAQDPALQAELLGNRDHLVGLLRKGFETLYKEPGDQADFDSVLAYMAAVA
jgi:hypothetical protein